MRFFDRENELERLVDIERRSRLNAQFTVLTGRWHRFVKVAYMLSDDRMQDWLVLMVKKGLKGRLCDAIPIMRKCGAWCCFKWLAIVSLYTARGIMDAIHDRVEDAFRDCNS